MKILFCDFDGVINSLEWYKHRVELGLPVPNSILERSYQEIDPPKLKMISDFVIEMNAEVVVSSSWRILHPIQELRDIVTQCGWKAPPFLDITPRARNNFRGDEVRAWLTDSTKRNVEILEPITHHVIFDDDGDFHPDQPLVKTSWEFGIQQVHIDKAREILLK